MIDFIYSLNSDPKKAFEELKVKVEHLDFKPNLAVVYLTENLQKDAQLFRFDFDTLCVPVEGFITPEGVWTRGCLCMFADIDYSLNVYKGGIDEVVSQLRQAEKGKFNLLVYPLFYVESKYSFLVRYLKLRITSDLERASKIFEDMIYPMNTMLRPFRDESKEAVGLNLFPVKMGVGKPQIFLNGEKIGRGVVHLAFNHKFDLEYTDFLPERGNDVEETKEILKKEFQFIEEVEVEKATLAIGKINGLSIKEYLERHKIRMREDLNKEMEEEKFFGATPYGLLFFSEETGGAAGLGLMDYDLRFYPSLFDLSVFSGTGVFVGEKLRGGVEVIESELNSSYDFVFMDQNILLMFEDKVVRVFRGRNVYGVVLCSPSYTENLKSGKRMVSEVESNIYVNTTLSTILLNF